jgi:DNA polymerase III epsilon subunit family exonuclease
MEIETDGVEAADNANSADCAAGAIAPTPHSGARGRLLAWLAAHPAGADARELIGLLFKSAGRDPELGARLIRGLLGGVRECAFDPATGLWTFCPGAALKIPLAAARFVVVDLETTGGRAAPDSIIEIGACELIGGRVTRSFATLVRPAMRIPRFIARLTSIDDEMVADAPPIRAALPAFRDFLGDGVMVAHNAPFDFSFLDLEFRRLFGAGIGNPVLCTLKLSRRLLPSLKSRRLGALAEDFGLSTDGRHRGWGDARMAAELLAIFLEMAAQMGIARLDRLLAWNQRGPANGRIKNFKGRRLESAAIRADDAPRADEPNLSPEQPNALRSQASQP